MSTHLPTVKKKFTSAIDYAIHERMRTTLHTMMPGILKEYNPETKRANILPSIRLIDREGETYSRPLLLDVPVVCPSTGGIMIHHKIEVDDVMMVFFSERGLDNFKKQWKESNPVPGRFFHVMDAVAVRWGVENIKPVDEDAYVIQSKTGNTYIKLKEDLIELKCGNTKLRLTPNAGWMS